MKGALVFVALVVLCVTMGCSLPPERPVKKEELYKTQIYTFYTIKESPERVLAALNKDGEVVLEAEYKKQPLYVKILVPANGPLMISVSER